MVRHIARILRRAPWLMVLPHALWRLIQPKYTLGVVGVVFNAQGHVLLVEHVFHPKTPWGLPGGWVGRRENPALTVKRELKEELELDVQVGTIIHINRPHSNHLDMAYLCHLVGEIGAVNYELLGYRWVDPMQMPRILSFHYQAIQIAIVSLQNDQ